MLQPDRILYEAEVTATGGRDGKAASSVASPVPTTGIVSAERSSYSPGSWKWPMT